MTTNRKVSLTQYLRRITAVREPEVIRALNGLVGLPFGGWPETKQAELAIREVLPRPRSFSTAELIAAEMMVDDAGRYRWKYHNDRRQYFLKRKSKEVQS